MTPEAREAIRQRAEQATKGPWKVWDHRGHPTVNSERRREFRGVDEATLPKEQWTGPKLPQSMFGINDGNGNAMVIQRFEDGEFIAHSLGRHSRAPRRSGTTRRGDRVGTRGK